MDYKQRFVASLRKPDRPNSAYTIPDQRKLRRNESLLKKLLENEQDLDNKSKNIQIKSSLNISRALDVDHLVEGRNTFSHKFVES